jgi:hypothetical protein
MIISHKRFGIIETEVFFEKHPKNSTDPLYLNYTDDEKKAVTGKVDYVDAYDIKKGKVIIFNIVMDGIHQYKKF